MMHIQQHKHQPHWKQVSHRGVQGFDERALEKFVALQSQHNPFMGCQFPSSATLAHQ
jgi:hypothetical protein